MTIASYVRSFDEVVFGAAVFGAAAFGVDVFGMSGGPSVRVVEGQPGDVSVEVLVAMTDRELQSHARTRGRQREGHAGEGDVALEHRRVHEAGRIPELPEVIVVDVVLLLDRRVVLGRDETRLVEVAVVLAPIEHETSQLPARRLLRDLAGDRVATKKGPIRCRQILEHPAKAELDRGRSLGVGPGEAARLEVDVEEQEASLDPGH